MSINPNSPADFSPTLEGYTGQGAFRFWCQQVLPLVFDDSISYYELLNKVVVYLNNVIKDVSAAETNISALSQAYKQLENYVNDYFSSLDVQHEIDNKLDSMAASGELSNLIEPYVTDKLPVVVEEQIDDVVADQLPNVAEDQLPGVTRNILFSNASPLPTAVNHWLDVNVNPVGSAVTVDSSLSIPGSAGDAAATGNTLKMSGSMPCNTKVGKLLSKTTGNWINESDYESVYTLIEHTQGNTYLYKGRHIPSASSACNVAFYDSSQNFISALQFRNSEYEILSDSTNIPNNTAYIQFTSSRDTTTSNPMIYELYQLTKIVTASSGGDVVRYSGAIPYLYNETDNIKQTYNNEVPAIAEQVEVNKNGISMTGAISFKNCPTHGYYTSDGTYQYSGGINSVEADVDVAEGEKFLFRSNGGGSGVSYLMYDSNDDIVQYRSWGATDYHIITIPANVVKVKFTGHYNYTTTSDPNFELYKITHIIGKFYNDIEENKTAISSELNNMVGTVPYTLYKQGFYNTSGEWIASNDYTTGATMVNVSVGDSFVYKGRADNSSSNPDRLAGSVVLFDSSDNVVESYRFSADDYHRITIPDGVTKAFFASFKYQTAPLIFELYKSGAINQIMGDFTKTTLNSMNRAYAASSMRTPTLMDTMDEAVVCIGFDDYNLDYDGEGVSRIGQGIDYLAQRGMPCYLSLIPDNVTDGWALAKKCYDNGGEICAHSHTPITSNNQGFDILNYKFIRIPEIIGYHGFPVYGIIRAGGNDIESANDSINEFYARASGMKYSDYYGRVPNSGKSVYRLGRTNLTTKTLSQWETTFDNLVQNNGYLILYCHHLNGTEGTDVAYPNGFTLTDFENIINAISARNIKVMTINELVDKYAYNGINTSIVTESSSIEFIPPASLSARNAGAFTNYRIYGAGDGTINATPNLFTTNHSWEQGAIDNDSGVNTASSRAIRSTGIIPINKSVGNIVISAYTDYTGVESTSPMQFMCYVYDSNGVFIERVTASWNSFGTDLSRRYRIININKESYPENIALRFIIRVENNAVITPTIAYNTQLEINNSVSVYKAPVNEIVGCGDLVSDSRSAHFCEYVIPVVNNNNTVNVYLDKPLIVTNNNTDYVDYKTGIRYNGDGTQDYVTLPELNYNVGLNAISCDTTITPSKMLVEGCVKLSD